MTSPGPRDADGRKAGHEHALRLAAVLAGAWRRPASAPEVTPEELGRLVPGLLKSGTAALAWWRIRDVSLGAAPAAERLRRAYHLHALEATLHERDLAESVGRLRAAGVAPVLVKGAAVARLYPEKGLRPYGDFDLCVRPDQYRAAAAALEGQPVRFSLPDLHQGFRDLAPSRWDEVWARAEVARFGALEVHVLGPEDHLRLLCLHLLRHGGGNPRWLCDVAVAVEARPPGFDWARCLGAGRRQADWVASAIGLGARLLGTRVADTPVAARAERLPDWLVTTVLQHWGRHYGPLPGDGLAPPPDTPGPRRPGAAPGPGERDPARRPSVLQWEAFDHGGSTGPAPATAGARTLARLRTALARNWPNPVAATVHLGGSFSDAPRGPIQAVDAVARLVRFGWRRTAGRIRRS